MVCLWHAPGSCLPCSSRSSRRPRGRQAHRVTRSPRRPSSTSASPRCATPCPTARGRRCASRSPVPTGLDYVAVALPRHQPEHALVALVAVVNRRPRGSQAPDLAQIAARARGRRAPCARPRSRRRRTSSPRRRPAPRRRARLGALSVSDLRFALRAGAPPPGFGARSTIAQALNAACGRPVDTAFRAAVAPPALPAPSPKPHPVPAVPAAPAAASRRHRVPASPPPAVCPDAGVIDCPAPARPRERTTACPTPRLRRWRPIRPPARPAAPIPYGRYLEEFEVGAVYKHWPAKTVTEADDHLFCLITMNHHPLHINDVYAAQSQQGRNVVVGPLVYSLALGMSVSRRLRQGDRQPRHRGAQAPGAGLPRRHAVRGVRGAREARVAVQARPGDRQGPHRGYTTRTATLVAEFKRLVLVPAATAGGIQAPPRATWSKHSPTAREEPLPSPSVRHNPRLPS